MHKSLQFRILALHNKYSTRLINIVVGWIKILEMEFDAIQAQAEGRGEIPNPFIFGNPVAATEYNIFTGRHDMLNK